MPLPNPLAALTVVRRPRPVPRIAGPLARAGLHLFCVLLCILLLVPFTAASWLILATIAELRGLPEPPPRFALIAATFSSWAWMVVFYGAIERLQLWAARRQPPAPSRAAPLFAHWRGIGAHRSVPADMGWLAVNETSLLAAGVRAELRIRGSGLTAPAERRGRQTVFLPVPDAKNGLIFTVDNAQDLLAALEAAPCFPRGNIRAAVDKLGQQG